MVKGMGGAMDLVSSAKTKVVVTMEHSAKVTGPAFGNPQHTKPCTPGPVTVAPIDSIYLLRKRLQVKAVICHPLAARLFNFE